MKHFILEDASFVVALIDKDDNFHEKSWKIFNNFVKIKQYIRILIPSLAFFESFAVLTRKGIPYKDINEVMWRLLHREEVFNVSLIEIMAFRMCRKYCDILQDDSIKDGQGANIFIKSTDFFISCTGIDYEAQILTFVATQVYQPAAGLIHCHFYPKEQLTISK